MNNQHGSSSTEPETSAGAVGKPLNADDLVYRQVHPMHTRETAGGLSPEAFTPQRGHSNLLSTLHGRIGADAAFHRWTVEMQHESLGSFGVTAAEVSAVRVDPVQNQQTVDPTLNVYEDGASIGVPDHCSIDFNALTKGQRKQAARKLLDYALDRGGALNTPAEDEQAESA